MSYQQIQVPCPANQWTPISEYRPTRKSLRVQCPQVANAIASTEVSVLNDGVGHSVLAADPFRVRNIFSLAFVQASVTRIQVSTGSVGGGFGLLADFAAGVPASLDTGYSQSAGQQWYLIAVGDGTHGQTVEIITETAQCRALILATTTLAAVAGGPYGSTPPGYWVSSDISSSNVNFELTEAKDGEGVIQVWYAWPVGSVAVNLTVSESWEINQPAVLPKTFRVDLPKLSPDAIAALNDLLGRMRQYDDLATDTGIDPGAQASSTSTGGGIRTAMPQAIGD